MKGNNPALRLHAILIKGMEHPSASKNSDVWMEILGLEHHSQLLGKLGSVMSLVSDITERLKLNDENMYTAYLGWIPSLTSAFSKQDLNGNWATFKNNLPQTTIDQIYVVSKALPNYSNSKDISDEEVKDIYKQARSLLEEIKSSSLPKDLQSFMCKHLNKICLALDEYEIKGSEFLSGTIEEAYGDALLKQLTLLNQNKSNPIYNNFWKFMGRLATTVTVITGCITIGDEIRALEALDFLPELVDSKITSTTPNTNSLPPPLKET